MDLGIHQINATYNSFTLQWTNPSNYCVIANITLSLMYNGGQLNDATYSVQQIGTLYCHECNLSKIKLI